MKFIKKIFGFGLAACATAPVIASTACAGNEIVTNNKVMAAERKADAADKLVTITNDDESKPLPIKSNISLCQTKYGRKIWEHDNKKCLINVNNKLTTDENIAKDWAPSKIFEQSDKQIGLKVEEKYNSDNTCRTIAHQFAIDLVIPAKATAYIDVNSSINANFWINKHFNETGTGGFGIGLTPITESEQMPESVGETISWDDQSNFKKFSHKGMAKGHKFANIGLTKSLPTYSITNSENKEVSKRVYFTAYVFTSTWKDVRGGKHSLHESDYKVGMHITSTKPAASKVSIAQPNTKADIKTLYLKRFEKSTMPYSVLKDTQDVEKMRAFLNEEGTINFHGDNSTNTRVGYVPFKIEVTVPAKTNKEYIVCAKFQGHVHSNFSIIKGHAADKFASNIFYFGQDSDQAAQAHPEFISYPYKDCENAPVDKTLVYRGFEKSNDKEKWDHNWFGTQEDGVIKLQNDTDKEITKTLYFGISLADCWRDSNEANTWFDFNVTPTLIDTSVMIPYKDSLKKNVKISLEEQDKFIKENTRYLAGEKYENALTKIKQILTEHPEKIRKDEIKSWKQRSEDFIKGFKDNVNTLNNEDKWMYDFINTKENTNRMKKQSNKVIDDFFNDDECFDQYKEYLVDNFKVEWIKGIQNYNSEVSQTYEPNGEMYGYISDHKTDKCKFNMSEITQIKRDLQDNQMKNNEIYFSPYAESSCGTPDWVDTNCVSYTGFSIDYTTPAYTTAVHYLKPAFQFELAHAASQDLNHWFKYGRTDYSVQLFYFGEGNQAKNLEPEYLLNPANKDYEHQEAAPHCVGQWLYHGTINNDVQEDNWQWEWTTKDPFITIIDRNENNPKPINHKLYFGVALVTSGVINNGNDTTFRFKCRPALVDANQEISADVDGGFSTTSEHHFKENQINRPIQNEIKNDDEQRFITNTETNANYIYLDGGKKSNDSKAAYIPLEQKIIIPPHTKATLNNNISLVRQWKPDTRANVHRVKMASTVAGYEYKYGLEKCIPEYIPTKSYVPYKKAAETYDDFDVIDPTKNSNMISYTTKTNEYHTYKNKLYPKGKEGWLALDIIGDILTAVSVVDIVGNMCMAGYTLFRSAQMIEKMIAAGESAMYADQIAKYSQEVSLLKTAAEEANALKNTALGMRTAAQLEEGRRLLDAADKFIGEFARSLLNAETIVETATQGLKYAQSCAASLKAMSIMSYVTLLATGATTATSLAKMLSEYRSGTSLYSTLMKSSKFNHLSGQLEEEFPDCVQTVQFNNTTHEFRNSTNDPMIFTYYSGVSYCHESINEGSNANKVQMMIVNDPIICYHQYY